MPERVTGALGRANLVPDSGRSASSVNAATGAEWVKLRSSKNKSLVVTQFPEFRPNLARLQSDPFGIV